MKGLRLVAEHYVLMTELRNPANILDLGCRGFEFTKYFDERGDFVVPVDIDPNLGGVRPYVNVAISDYTGTCGIKRSKDAQATSMSRIITDEVVNCTTLESLMESAGIPYFDLIKCDIEGAEFEMIQSLTKAPAKQLSIEFHLHTGAYSKTDADLMVTKLHMLGYKTVTHEFTAQHGAGFNYWSSLFIR